MRLRAEQLEHVSANENPIRIFSISVFNTSNGYNLSTLSYVLLIT